MKYEFPDTYTLPPIDKWERSYEGDRRVISPEECQKLLKLMDKVLYAEKELEAASNGAAVSLTGLLGSEGVRELRR